MDSQAAYQLTGCPLVSIYYPARLSWCRENGLDAFTRIVAIKEYVFHRLAGGITHARLWSQILCDVLGVPLELMEAADASAVGAARLGWSALGGNIPPLPDPGLTLTPDPALHEAYRRYYRDFQQRYLMNY